LTKGAVVTGDVFYNLIEMSMGSKIDGNLKHSTVSAKVEQISSASPVISADKP
jgi:cytoskeletal protein CcmA (bactofilin family)